MIVLVTGGSSGIGLATVRRLAAAGHRVFAASRNPTRAEYPASVTALELDVADRDATARAARAVLAVAGGIDVLVNNAGTGAIGALEDTADDEAHRIFEVNVFGPMRLARAVIPTMREQGHGRIINVTSMNDVLPAPFAAWYSASKAALASASAVLDAEVHRFGISVTVIAPGFFRTEMAEALGDYAPPEGSPYAHELAGLLEANRARIPTAADPDIVAKAIEDAINAPAAPARVVVGADAEAMVKLVDDTDPEAFAVLLRDFVSQLSQ